MEYILGVVLGTVLGMLAGIWIGFRWGMAATLEWMRGD